MNSSYIISDFTFLPSFSSQFLQDLEPKRARNRHQQEVNQRTEYRREFGNRDLTASAREAMILLLISITVLHLSSLAMLLIATLEKAWWIWDDSKISDLWYNCFQDNTTNTWLCAATNENDWLQSVQALMVLSVVFSSLSFLVFLGQLFAMSRGGLFYFTGFCQAFAGFTDFAACLIFTFHRKEILADSRDLNKGRFGYCFILAWVSVPLLLVSGVLYVHLRKKQ